MRGQIVRVRETATPTHSTAPKGCGVGRGRWSGFALGGSGAGQEVYDVAVELAAVPIPDACEVAERHPTRGVPVAAGPSNRRGRSRGGEGGMGAFGWGMQVRFSTLILVQEMRKFKKEILLGCD